ncbi:MAG: hypothetical protein ACRDZW_03485, partial [Acidimicrobiales bacterium]
MTTLRRLGAGGLAASLAAAGSVLAMAAPVAAAPVTISFSAPGDGARVDKSAVTVAATVRMPDGRLKSISLSVTPAGGGAAVNGGPVAGNDAATKDVSFPVTLPLNGRYTARITATGNDSLLNVGRDSTVSATRDFAVVAPPAAPRGVKTAVNADTRAVTITWTKNTEPDLLFYLVQRSKGGGEFVLSARTEEATVVDPTPSEGGGEYTYQVVAVRKGATDGEGVNSNPSSASPVTVPDPPAPPTTAPPPAAPGDTTPTTAATAGEAPPITSGGPSTTVTTLAAGNPGALTKSGTVDLSGLRKLQTQATRPPRVLTTPTTDPGFTETLPFDTRPADSLATDGGSSVDETAIDDTELGSSDSNVERTRALAFLAAGLLATVLLMHLLWVKGEVARVPLEPLPPGPAKGARRSRRPPPPPVASRRPPRPAVGSAPGPANRPRRPPRPPRPGDVTA